MRNDPSTHSDDTRRSVHTGRFTALLPIGSLILFITAALLTGVAIGAQNNWYALAAALVFAVGLVLELAGRNARRRRQLQRRERSKKYLTTGAIPVVPPAEQKSGDVRVPVTTGAFVAAPTRTESVDQAAIAMRQHAVPYALLIPAVCPEWVRTSRAWANRVVERLPALNWQASMPAVMRQKFFFSQANSVPAVSGGQILDRAWYQLPAEPVDPQRALGDRVRENHAESGADPVTLQHICAEINKLLHTIDSIPVVPPAQSIDVTDATMRSQNAVKPVQRG